MNHVDPKDFLSLATGTINARDRFIAESVSSIRFEEGQNGEIVLFATAYAVSDGVQNDHAIHEFTASTPLSDVLRVLADSPNGVLRQLATTTIRS